MRLGVNIDHLATLRQLRGTPYPDLLEGVRIIETAGAHQITMHLREDRRHIQDKDVHQIRTQTSVQLNLEMAATDFMVRFANRVRPDWVCLVPEKRQELTTEGGLDVSRNQKHLRSVIQKLKKTGIRVSLFIEPSQKAVESSQDLGGDAVELHTGRFCLATQSPPGSRLRSLAQKELLRIEKAARLAQQKGLHVHAGHGFDYENIRDVVNLGIDATQPNQLPLIEEFNIGHSIICRAALVGLERAVREMVSAIQAP